MATALKSDAVFSATELGLSFGLQQILDGATVAVYPGEKVGLVGRNGCGKSSFLKIVAGAESADAGTVAYRQGAVVGYLPQDFELRDEATVVENVRDGVRELLEAIGRYESGEALSDGESERLLAKIEAEDGWNIGTRIESLMRELSAPGGERIVGTLSGGEKRRVALCRALVVRPDLLILDEPTNHLDAESVTWLEGALAGLTGACLFVTHDRYFLDRIATRIIELSAGRFFSHEGNYSDYLVAKAERQEREATVEKKRQGFLRREVEWVRAGVKARGTKQRSRIDNFYAVKAQKAPEKDLDMELVVPPAPPLGNVVVELEKAGVTRGEAGRLFSGMDLVFEPGQCTGVLGKNGVGKSTLLSVVLGELEPTEGTRRVGKKTIFNYVDQSRLQLDEEKSLLEEVSGDQEFVQFGDEQISVRGYLRRFLFSDDRINEPVKNLSGGEKARVLLAKILRRGGNFLVLDEPTNDLDLATLRVLEEAIINFGGAVLVVSHDRYFLDRVCDRVVAFEGCGQVYIQPGNYSYYLQKRKEREAKYAAAAAVVKKKAVKSSGEGKRARKLTWKEEREFEGMEGAILELEERVEAIEGKLNDPGFYVENAVEAVGLTEELEVKKKEVEGLYARWEELERLKG